MKAPTLLLILVTLCSNLYSTDRGSGTAVRACAATDRHQYRTAMDEDYRNKLNNMEESLYDIMSEQLSNGQSSKMMNSPFELPIVFHVIHENGIENISDSEIFSALQNLNDAFASTGYFSNTDGQDSGISFCLANLDPNGNPSNGINRINSSLTEHSMSEEMDLKNLIRWNPLNYINVWIVKTINNETIGGYSYLAHISGDDEDGIVVDYNYINSNPVLSVPFIHEVGHYMNLYHTFESGCPNDDCLSSGDRICDTPPDNVTYTGSGCLVDNSCNTDGDDTSTYNPFTSDMTDLDISFMDYSQFSCMSIFTPHQILRMRNSLYSFRNDIVNSYGCSGSILPSASFSQNTMEICAGSEISFYDNSEGYVSNYNWSFPGGTPSSSNQKNPKVTYNTEGTYDVSLSVTNANGSDQSSINNAVSVNSSSNMLVFFEDFESGFGANLWTIENPDFQESWEIILTAAYDNGERSCYINNFNSANSTATDRMKSKSIDLSEYESVVLEMDYAYGSSSLTNEDSLIVYILPEGGSPIEVFVLEGDGSSYSTISETYEFFPLSSDDWCSGSLNSCISIDLSAFAGQGNIQFIIEGISKGGNNMFIDNIALIANCGDSDLVTAPAPVVQISSSAAQSCEGEYISFSANANNSDQLYWQFPGGIPAVSFDPNPVVYFENSGVYNITIEATGPGGISSTNMLVTIDAQPEVSIANLPTSTFESTPIALTGSPSGGTFSGPGIVNNVFSPQSAGSGFHQIYYSYTDQNGCSASESQSIFVFDIEYNFATYNSVIISPRGLEDGESILVLQDFSAYPIPTHNTLTIDWLNENDEEIAMTIVSADGKLLVAEKLIGFAPYSIDLSDFSAGLYLIRLKQGEKIKTLRINKS